MISPVLFTQVSEQPPFVASHALASATVNVMKQNQGEHITRARVDTSLSSSVYSHQYEKINSYPHENMRCTVISVAYF